jgi:hypothetical protein
MQRFASWSLALVTIGIIMADLSLGAGGPAGRTLSRYFFWPVLSACVTTTFLAYLVQYRYPSPRLWLVNLATVVLILFITLPVWHFGVELVPDGKPIFRWWVNPLVMGFGAVVFLVLRTVTKSLRPE